MDPFWNITRREMAQKLGTDGNRDMFFQDIWIRNLQKRLSESTTEVAIITDLRFNNEAEWIKKNHYNAIINIQMDSLDKKNKKYSHNSEFGINKFLYT